MVACHSFHVKIGQINKVYLRTCTFFKHTLFRDVMIVEQYDFPEAS